MVPEATSYLQPFSHLVSLAIVDPTALKSMISNKTVNARLIPNFIQTAQVEPFKADILQFIKESIEYSLAGKQSLEDTLAILKVCIAFVRKYPGNELDIFQLVEFILYLFQSLLKLGAKHPDNGVHVLEVRCVFSHYIYIIQLSTLLLDQYNLHTNEKLAPKWSAMINYMKEVLFSPNKC